MKIVICGSMIFSKQMVEISAKLQELGHEVILPDSSEEFVTESEENIVARSIKDKVEHNLIQDYFNEIKNSDAVLIVNKTKNNIENYVGGNAFLELAFGHVLNKKVFLLNPIPNVAYRAEIIVMQPTILNGDLTKISD